MKPEDTLPFVLRVCGRYLSKEEIIGIRTGMIFEETIDPFELWVTPCHAEWPQERLIIIPRVGLRYKDTNTRRDILWLWKRIADKEGSRMTTGIEGGIYLLHTTALRRYIPTPDPSAGSWLESRLMWNWIKYITGLSLYKQKKGGESRHLEEFKDSREALGKVSELLAGENNVHRMQVGAARPSADSSSDSRSDPEEE